MAVSYNSQTGQALRLGDDGQWSPTKIAKNPQTGETLALDGTEWKPLNKSAGKNTLRKAVDYLDGATGQLAHGVTSGFSDEVAALGDAVGGVITGNGWDYQGSLDRIQRRQRDWSEDNPIASTLLEGVGGLAAGGGAASALPKAATWIGKAAQSAGIGAGVGALSGFGGSDGGIDDRMTSAVGGAIFGAGIGAAAPAVAEGLAKGVGAISHASMRRAAPQSAAARKLAESLETDQIPVGEVAARVEALGPHATIADIGSMPMGLAEVLAQQPGKTRSLALDVLPARQQGQGERIYKAAKSALGARGDFYGTVDDLVRQRAVDAAPLYDEAFKVRAVFDDRLKQFLDDPVAKAGLSHGLKIQRLEALAEGRPFNPADYAVTAFNEAGDPIIGNVPTMRTWDAIKRGLDNMLEQYRDPTTGRVILDQQGRALDAVRKSLLNELDRVNPVYAQARAAWSGPSQAIEAANLGRQFARGDVEVTNKIIARMSESEREFYREGVLRELSTMIGRGAEGVDKTRTLLKTPKTRDALQAAFGKDFEQFRRVLESEARMAETNRTVLSNSATYRRQEASRMLGADPAPITDLTGTNASGVVLGVARKALQAIRSMPQSEKDALGRMLLSPDRSVQAEAIAELQRRAERREISQAAVDAVRHAITVGGSTATGLLMGR